MASAPPQGNMPTLPPDEDRKGSFLAFIYTTFAIGTFVLAFRLYVRFKIKSMGVDDWLMLAAWHLWVATTVTTTLYSVSGGTKHVFYITDPMDLMNVLKYNYINEVFGSLAPAIGKLSVGALIIRLMERGASKVQKILLYAFMAIYTTMTVLLVIFIFAQCNPSAALWDKAITTASCWDPSVFVNYSIAQSSLGTFMDFFLALSPIPIVVPLSLKLPKKIALCGLLSLGVFAGICSAVKTAQLKEISNSQDPTWGTYDLYMWAEAELFLVVVCGCIPTLKPLYEFIAHGTTIGPSGAHIKPSYTSYKFNNSSGAPGSSTSSNNNNNHRYMLNSRDTDTEYLTRSQTGRRNQSPADKFSIQHTQEYEVEIHDRANKH